MSADHALDVSFTVSSKIPIPADHGYHLYAAISRVLPLIHETNGIGIHPIRGRMIGGRQMQLANFSRLTIRLAANRMVDVLPLSGTELNVAGRTVQVGIPQVFAITTATLLHSRLVTIKGFMDAAPFLAALRRQLGELGISSEAETVLGKRRTIRIRDKEVVGYEVLLQSLTAEESLSVQVVGLGGRRHMGCGVFAPFSPRLSPTDVDATSKERP